MKTIDINKLLTDTYLQLLKNLSPGNKLDLIAKLTQSIKSDIEEKKSVFKRSFGAWQGNANPEELADDIRNSRQLGRQTEGL